MTWLPTDEKSKQRFCSFTHFLQQGLISSTFLSLSLTLNPGVLRSLITTLLQRLSQPLWWDSQWRPLSPTTMPKSRLEPPRSPACRSVYNNGRFCQFTTEKSLNKMHECHFCVSSVPSAPPAAADGESGAERNPCRTRDPQIHLWQFGPALPTSSKRSGKSFLSVVFIN